LRRELARPLSSTREVGAAGLQLEVRAHALSIARERGASR
jgi:hypothetical protein